MKHLLFLLILLITIFSCPAQTLHVGSSLNEEAYRLAQLAGDSTANASSMIRPLYPKWSAAFDTTLPLGQLTAKPKIVYHSVSGKTELAVLPLEWMQQYTSHHPFGWNDGGMIPAKGYQAQVSGGLFARWKFLSVQLRPEFVLAQNSNVAPIPIRNFSDTFQRNYYYIINRIDQPERFGTGTYARLLPGQSSVRIHYKKLSLGFSTENLWWGPGVRNSLLMSNTAPGFPHLTFNSTQPVKTPIGSWEWQVVAGWLQSSGYLPGDTSLRINGEPLYQPKANGSRYLNGLIFTWQPKWTKGLHLGFSRVFYQYSSNVRNSLNGYLPVLTAFFKNNTQDESSFGRDQLLSLFFRLLLPASGAEVYGEFGRNDHSGNLRDLLLEPEHARAYLIGVRKLFPQKNKNALELTMELTHLQSSLTRNVREQEGWYTHYQVRHGYTQLGQVLGTGIGPGGSSQFVGLNLVSPAQRKGVSIERIVRNNDFYFNTFSGTREFMRHWVDFNFTAHHARRVGPVILAGQLSLIHTLNYQWQKNKDVNQLQARLHLAYPF